MLATWTSQLTFGQLHLVRNLKTRNTLRMKLQKNSNFEKSKFSFAHKSLKRFDYNILSSHKQLFDTHGPRDRNSYNFRIFFITVYNFHLQYYQTSSKICSIIRTAFMFRWLDTIVSEMTYTVSSGTLNSSIPYHTIDWILHLSSLESKDCYCPGQICTY